MRKNLIAQKMSELHDLGVSYEAMCVKSDLKYYTLMNIFTRQKVSSLVLLSLKNAGFITDDDIQEYKKWLSKIKPSKSKT